MSKARRLIPSLPLVVLLLARCGVGAVAPEDAPALLRTAVSPAGWERVDRGAFSFAVPPGFEKTDAVPIDSDAASWVRDRASFAYDYGFYSPRVDDPTAVVRIGGRDARIRVDQDAAGFSAHAHWEKLGESHGMEISLSMYLEAPDRATFEELLATLYSVRFD